MAYTTIDKSDEHFNTVLYSGTGNENAITGVGFQPDWTWLKDRSQGYSHGLFDSSRGANKKLNSNNTNAETTPTEEYKSFDSDGFTLGTANGVNQSSDNFVAWNWKANGGTTSSNSNGDITSTVQTNSTAGFSIGTYTGDADNTHSVGHGLGATPAWIIVKRREGTHSWIVWHQNLTATTAYALDLENTDAEANNTSYFHDTAPDANTFHPGNGGATNGSGGTYVFYAFKEIQGYSKFGSYTGNGNTDGVFVYTGFKPAWALIRATDSDEWRIYDNKRANPFNVINVRIKADSNAAESQDDNECDFLSNGIKFRSNSGGVNTTDQKYIYMTFAEHPFVSSKGVPVTAR